MAFAFVTHYFTGKMVRLLVPEVITRVSRGAVIGRLLQIYHTGPLPSTTSLLRTFRTVLGGTMRTQTFYDMTRPYQLLRKVQQGFTDRGATAMLKVSETIPSLFSEEMKYRYQFSRTFSDPFTGETKTSFRSILSGRSLSVSEMGDALSEILEGSPPLEGKGELDEWGLDFVYRDVGDIEDFVRR